jgi:hypothetical protein
MDPTEVALAVGGFYIPECFPFQTCKEQKLRIGYALIGVEIHSFIQESGKKIK